MIRLAILEKSLDSVSDHLKRNQPFEEGAFLILRAGKGVEGSRLLATEVIFPPEDGWEIQEEGMLRPSARWLSAAISHAYGSNAGLLFVHSHPDPQFPQSLSLQDLRCFRGLAETVAPILDGLFAAAIVHPQGWSGVVWLDGEVVPIERIVSVGRGVEILSPLPLAPNEQLDARQKDALGRVHDILANLTVAVVGCGGVGSVIAEQLVRIGVGEILLIDCDFLDTPSNVRRVFGSKRKDLELTEPRSKVSVVSEHLREIGLPTFIKEIFGDVRTEQTFRSLLDADVVIIATDTHGSRAAVNDLPSTYLLPVVDVGVRSGQKANGRLSGLLAEVRVLTPETPCLWCRSSIHADTIRAENMSQEERQKLEREGYLAGSFGQPAPSVVALTVLGSALATCSLLALLSDEADAAFSGYWVDGLLGDSGETMPTQPKADCRCCERVGLGDNAMPPFIGEAATETAISS